MLVATRYYSINPANTALNANDPQRSIRRRGLHAGLMDGCSGGAARDSKGNGMRIDEAKANYSEAFAAGQAAFIENEMREPPHDLYGDARLAWYAGFDESREPEDFC